ncbi:2Fe-2S iron-sulfur cluster binding domain-containing protein [Nonomuraea sp. PA05]|uniref:2Fe-2S iron-sulfur cluster-binding protein n=1 Tax=Nonomuraea sp. PA05 TaxID=2604466 RepID=UPI0011D6F68D|nr:2Fe-2S iron-sulfur cluster-binding protein [Nonomuraea sp. PA05]TYB57439.1 2Fe-2S iron-sulfur cluster binding domain-containing protein [Nonomuraea sp. PA05]
MTGHIASLWVYPVKGARGVPLDEADVLPGTGLRHDRSLAIARGDQQVPPRTAWRPRSAFKQVARDPDMTQVTVTMAGSGVVELRHLAHPDGPPVRSDRPSEDLLGAWFGEPGLRLVRGDGAALWDLPDTELSLVNLATVRALAADLDFRRFRANVHLDGLPAFAELAWVGRRVRLGDCEVEVTRHTGRCRATSANLVTGERDIELPSVLTRAFGHPNLGVYARLAAPRPARLRKGAPVTVGDPPETVRHADASWPREAEVLETVREDDRTVSLWLRDPFRLPVAAGQHLRVHLPTSDGGLTWRAYSVSGRLRITVRLRGEVSNRLASLVSGDRLLITGPFGLPALSPERRPLYLVSAGIGITPVAATVRQLAAEAAPRPLAVEETVGEAVPRPLTVLHVDADERSAALWSEVADGVRRTGGTARLFETRPAARRPGPRDLVELMPDGADTLVCGSIGFVTAVSEALRAAGVDADRIHADAFFSPATEPPVRRPAPDPGPHQVTYLPEDVAATWTDADGTLLELAENHQVPVPSACRSGACGTCVLDLVHGEVSYLVDPPIPPGSRAVLACAAVPAGPIVLRRRAAATPAEEPQ